MDKLERLRLEEERQRQALSLFILETVKPKKVLNELAARIIEYVEAAQNRAAKAGERKLYAKLKEMAKTRKPGSEPMDDRIGEWPVKD